jgi:DNA polymerase V
MEWVRKNFGGVVGVRLLKQLRGEEIGEMKEPLINKKMIATTRMFGKRVTELKDIEEAVATYTARAAEKLRRQESAAGEISVFMMFQDMDVPKGEYVVRSIGNFELLPSPTSNTIYLTKVALKLIRAVFFKGRIYKKAGVILSRIVPDDSIQGNLFNPSINNNRQLMLALDNINFAFEADMIRLVRAGMSKHWKMRQELRSPRYTTVWNEIACTD